MSGLHEFRDPASNAARDDMLAAMKSGALTTEEIFRIGRRRELFDGVITGIIGTLHKKGAIQSAGHGRWMLAEVAAVREEFRPETVGEIETIAPETTRVGDTIVHKGVTYREEILRVKGNSPRGRIRELMKRLDHWESQGHTTTGIAYLRRHFKDAL